jgi:hypothetical protein
MRNWLLVSIVVSMFALTAPVSAQTTASTEKPAGDASAAQSAPKSAPKRGTAQSGAGHVYLMRGLLNIFSLGMDDLAAKIQAKGISATVHNHSEWQAIADDIAAKYKAGRHGPIVLVGHSLGADAVMFMAEYLGKKGVPVALVVPFDGTGSFAASSNVGQVMNLTQRDYAHMRRGAGFRGQLNNIDVSSYGVGHIDIDKSDRLHAMVLTRIQGVIRGRPASRTAGDGPAPAPRVRPAAASESNLAVPAAPSRSAVDVAPATTASTNASAGTAPDRSTPALPRPASVPTESSATRTPASSDATTKPALRF